MNRLRKYIYKSLAFQDNEETTQLLNGLKEIAKRDGWSFSKLAHEAFLEYLDKHGEGNPQLKIASYLPAAATGPLRVICWRFLKGAMKDGQVLCSQSGEGRWVNGVKCYSCKHNQCRQKVTTDKQEP